MAIQSVKVYMCDNGKSYQNYDEAKREQAKYVAEQIRAKSHRVHITRIGNVLAKVSANQQTNQLITLDLVSKNDVAIALRDALNKVIDYQRRIKKNG